MNAFRLRELDAEPGDRRLEPGERPDVPPDERPDIPPDERPDIPPDERPDIPPAESG